MDRCQTPRLGRKTLARINSGMVDVKPTGAVSLEKKMDVFPLEKNHRAFQIKCPGKTQQLRPEEGLLPAFCGWGSVEDPAAAALLGPCRDLLGLMLIDHFVKSGAGVPGGTQVSSD